MYNQKEWYYGIITSIWLINYTKSDRQHKRENDFLRSSLLGLHNVVSEKSCPLVRKCFELFVTGGNNGYNEHSRVFYEKYDPNQMIWSDRAQNESIHYCSTV